jgi:hypothetical protein
MFEVVKKYADEKTTFENSYNHKSTLLEFITDIENKQIITVNNKLHFFSFNGDLIVSKIIKNTFILICSIEDYNGNNTKVAREIILSIINYTL